MCDKGSGQYMSLEPPGREPMSPNTSQLECFIRDEVVASEMRAESE